MVKISAEDLGMQGIAAKIVLGVLSDDKKHKHVTVSRFSDFVNAQF